MITTINKSKLADMYKMSLTTLHDYIKPHKDKIRKLGAKRVKNGKIIYAQNYNSKQLNYLVNQVFGDSPEGYEFNGNTFVKRGN